MSILQVKNLSKSFKGIAAVDDVSFEIEKGKITGLLGPNGAGKTTTIQMLLGLIKPSQGSINIFGLDIEKNREEILGRVNFSSPYVTLPGNLKVWENLATFGRFYGIKDIKNKIKELSEFFNISGFLNKMTSSLSTGQLTRLNLTKAFLNDPELLLLDEPTASLDPDVADRARKLLKKLQKEKGVTIIYTSHNMVEVEEICNRVIFLRKGKIIDDGAPEELVLKYGHKDLNDVFLEIARKDNNGW